MIELAARTANGIVRVLVLIGRFERDSGGAQRAIVNQMHASRSDRVRYTVCYLSGSGSAVDELPSEVESCRLSVSGPLDASIPRQLRRLVRERRIHIVHTHSPLSGIWSRLAFLLDRSVSIVASEQNTHQRYRSFTGIVNGLTLPRADRIACVSESVRHSFFAWEKRLLHRHGIAVVHNAIDPTDFLAVARPRPPGRDAAVRAELGASGDECVLFGNVARLDPQKNQGHLLEAFASIADTVPRATLALIGDGALRDSLHAHAEALGIADRVIFAGRRTDMLAVYSALDAFVLPSRHEGFSLALLEAMASGLPVVCSTIPEISEATGDACLASDPRDGGALASSLLAAASDPALRLSLGARARERVRRRFGASDMASAYEALYAELADRTPSIERETPEGRR